ncbi:hypothetical protein GCM10028857_20430 [Salinarchaeum chitinilyticum]
MLPDGDSRFYRWEFLVAGLAVAFEAFLTLRYGPALEYWWLGVVTAVGTALLWMAADRSRYGEWLVCVSGGVLIVAVLAGVPTLVDGSRMFTFGVWFGIGLNRLLFGVFRPIPEYRRSKIQERAASG